jgi:hypothetical protein
MSSPRAGGPRRSRLSVEALEDRLAPAVFTVVNENDSGAGSLRWAISRANAAAGPDIVRFNIPGGGVHRIDLASPLPAITGRVIVNGASQPGTGAGPRVEVSGASAGAGAHGVVINAGGGGSVVRGLVINRFAGDGVRILASGCAVIGCYIGTTAGGAAAAGNGGNGVSVEGLAVGNRIGGVKPVQRNVISGNGGYGVYILGAGARGNLVRGNFVGTNAAGTAPVGPGNVNGGVIIGMGARGNVVGGATEAARNVISGHAQDGVTLFGTGTSGNRVSGNYIGTDVTGTADLGNGSDGVFVTVGATGNVIGGTLPGQGNVISGNNASGVLITGNGTSGNQLLGNLIGTDATGATALPNPIGVHVTLAASGNFVGGIAAGAGNVISGNSDHAVILAGSGTTGNAVLGNRIGTDRTGARPLGNGKGVAVAVGAANNRVGGTEAGAGNLIAHNGGDGVYVVDGTGNSVLGNRIFANAGLGIDLWFDGVTANDPDDADAGGNDVLNFPVLTAAVAAGGDLTISGSINTGANKTLRIEFFASSAADPSGHGGAERYLGFVVVQTGAGTTATFAKTLAAAGVLPGQVVTATATDELGNTSEYSLALAVV